MLLPNKKALLLFFLLLLFFFADLVLNPEEFTHVPSRAGFRRGCGGTTFDSKVVPPQIISVPSFPVHLDLRWVMMPMMEEMMATDS